MLANNTVSKTATYMPKTAMIFAAGFGTRMRPITNSIPKPLVEVNGKPMIEYRLEKLKEIGVERVVVNVHYLADQIADYFSSYKGMEVLISHEEHILETGGGLVKALPLIGEDPFFIINGDVIWTDHAAPFALERLAAAWNPEIMDMLMLLHPRETAHGYAGKGDFDINEDGVVVKPSDMSGYPYIYAGIQLFHPKLLAGLKVEAFSLSTLFKQAVDSQSLLLNRMHGVVHKGDWLHVDSLESLAFAESFLAKRA